MSDAIILLCAGMLIGVGILAVLPVVIRRASREAELEYHEDQG